MKNFSCFLCILLPLGCSQPNTAPHPAMADLSVEATFPAQIFNVWCDVIPVTITNTGSADTDAGFAVGLFIQRDTTPPERTNGLSQPQIAEVRIPALKSSESVTVNISTSVLAYPTECDQGSCYISVWVDTLNAVGEVDENDNFAISDPIKTQSGRSNLTAQTINVASDSVENGAATLATSVITNNGSCTSPESFARIRTLSTNAFPVWSVFDMRVRVPPIPSGADHEFTTEIQIPAEVPPMDFTVTLEADANDVTADQDRVIESDEGDNTSQADLTTVLAADDELYELRMYSCSSTTCCSGGAPATFSIVGSNMTLVTALGISQCEPHVVFALGLNHRTAHVRVDQERSGLRPQTNRGTAYRMSFDHAGNTPSSNCAQQTCAVSCPDSADDPNGDNADDTDSVVSAARTMHIGDTQIGSLFSVPSAGNLAECTYDYYATFTNDVDWFQVERE